jgi:hypothetical protein
MFATGDCGHELEKQEQGRWLLGNVLDWHRREDKAAWWEYFRLCALSDEELLDEKSALSGLVFIEAVKGSGRTAVHRYGFPLQDIDIRDGEELRSQGGARLGTVAAISVEDRTIDIKKRKDTDAFHPTAIFSHQVIGTGVLADSLFRIGEHVARVGITGPGPYEAARILLLQAAPLTHGDPLQQPGETAAQAATRLAADFVGFLHPGSARGRQDPHRRADDLCPGASGQESRHHRQQPQSHPEPSG